MVQLFPAADNQGDRYKIATKINKPNVPGQLFDLCQLRHDLRDSINHTDARQHQGDAPEYLYLRS